MKTNNSRRLFFAAALGGPAFLQSGCMSQQTITRAVKTSQVLPDPSPVGRPIDEVLANFAAQIAPYYSILYNFRPIVIEVDFMPNDSGIEKELPINLGNYARIAVEKIGPPLQSYMAWPGIIAIPRIVGNPVPPNINNRPAPPAPSFRLVGALLRYSEVFEKRSDQRADGSGGGNRTEFDAQLTRDKGTTITKIQISLTLEHPNGVAVEGATATYEVEINRTELNRSISVFVAGTGIGFGGRYIATQNSGDAISDAVAVSVVHTLGNALKIPYDRTGSLFKSDVSLGERMRDEFRFSSRRTLEQTIKRFLFVDGYTMDVSTPELTNPDRAVVVLAMQRQSLDFNNHAALSEFAFRYWRTLDYKKAAKHIAAVLGSPRPASAPAEPSVLPSAFGFPPDTPIVVVDVSRVLDPIMRNRVISSARLCSGCSDIRQHSSVKTLLAIRTSSTPADVQRAINRTNLPFKYVWSDTPTPRVIIVPIGT